jgi:hypothetical protein
VWVVREGTRDGKRERKEIARELRMFACEMLSNSAAWTHKQMSPWSLSHRTSGADGSGMVRRRLPYKLPDTISIFLSRSVVLLDGNWFIYTQRCSFNYWIYYSPWSQAFTFHHRVLCSVPFKGWHYSRVYKNSLLQFSRLSLSTVISITTGNGAEVGAS